VSMKGWRRRRREQLHEALADHQCGRCLAVLEGSAALTIHTDAGCDHLGAFGQLVQLRDGRWSEWWRHPEIPRA
jgi:hypothetical protein